MLRALRPVTFFLMVLIYFLLLFGLLVVNSNQVGEVHVNDNQINAMKLEQALSVFVVFILPALLFTGLFSSEGVKYLKIHLLPNWRYIALGVCLILVAMPFNGLMEEWNKHLSLPGPLKGVEVWMKDTEAKAEVVEKAFMKDNSAQNLFINIVLIGLIAAFSEELFFRGVLQGAIQWVSGNIHVAVWTSAILFSAFHLQFLGFIPRVLLGAILGYCFAWSGSIWTTIAMHFTNNVVVLLLGFLIAQGKLPPSAENLGMESVASAIPLIGASLIGTGYCLYRLALLYKLSSKDDTAA